MLYTFNRRFNEGFEIIKTMCGNIEVQSKLGQVLCINVIVQELSDKILKTKWRIVPILDGIIKRYDQGFSFME